MPDIFEQQERELLRLQIEVEQLRAQAAALRDALEELYELWLAAKPLIERGDNPHLVPFMDLHQPIEAIDDALKGDAGADVLAVVTAARRLDNCVSEFERDALMACGEYFQALSDALANLDMRQKNEND